MAPLKLVGDGVGVQNLSFCILYCWHQKVDRIKLKKKTVLRILIQFLDPKFSFSADTSAFYVMIYNSKTCIIILNIDFDSKLKFEF